MHDKASVLLLITTFAMIVVTIILFFWLLNIHDKKHGSKLVKKWALIVGGWMILQSILAFIGFYSATFEQPRLIVGVLPTLALIAVVFISPAGRKVIGQLNLEALAWISTVRILAEIIIYLCAVDLLMPQLMTFDGYNMDIVMGLTAPIVAYFGIRKGYLGKIMLIIWNIVGIILLPIIIILAVLSTPYPFQQLAFDQPNIAIFYFPFLFLPFLTVPIVLFTHFASLKILFTKKHGS